MVNKQSTSSGNSFELFDYPTRFHELFPAKKMYIVHKICRKTGALQKFKAMKMMMINDNNRFDFRFLCKFCKMCSFQERFKMNT